MDVDEIGATANAAGSVTADDKYEDAKENTSTGVII